MAPSPRAEVPQRRYSSPWYSLQSLSPIFHQKSGLVPESKSRFVPQESKRSGGKPDFVVFFFSLSFPEAKGTTEISLGVLLIQMELGTSGEWNACEPEGALFSRFFAAAGSMFGSTAYPLSGQDPEPPTRGQQMISNLVLTPFKNIILLCFQRASVQSRNKNLQPMGGMGPGFHFSAYSCQHSLSLERGKCGLVVSRPGEGWRSRLFVCSAFEVRVYSQGKEGFVHCIWQKPNTFIVLELLIPKEPSHFTQIIR